jgi:hypothetical protein
MGVGVAQRLKNSKTKQTMTFYPPKKTKQKTCGHAILDTATTRVIDSNVLVGH